MDTARRSVGIEVPVRLHGELMHHLSFVGAVVQGLSPSASTLTVAAELPAHGVAALEAWLAEVPNGEGRIVRNDAINVRDA